ncbi:MAG: YerC/YecD family TrpR-related protein [Patescibacteria group bacterium]|jgi:TrpR-related protein YerC/YecD
MPTWDTPQTQDLFQTLLRVRNLAEMKKFLRDLLTPAEITEFSRRWKAAQMLDQGIPYTQIVAKTGLSSTTVARVQRWLTKGLGGYQLMLSQKKHHATHSRSRLTEA